MKTIGIIVVAVILLAVIGYWIIPGSSSRLAAAREQTGNVVDEMSSDQHLQKRVEEANRREWEDLQKNFSTIVDVENDIKKIEKDNQDLQQEKEKHLNYMKKANELLAKDDSSLISVGGQDFSRKEIREYMQTRYERCQEIDQLFKANANLISKQQATLKDIKQKYDAAKESILADLEGSEKIATDLARLRIEETMYQNIERYNKASVFRPRTESYRAMQSLNERLTQVQKSVRMYQEASSIDTVTSKDNPLQKALDQEFSGDIMTEIKGYLEKGSNVETEKTSSEKSLQQALSTVE